jgi:MOSC domain-containing protein YiiM
MKIISTNIGSKKTIQWKGKTLTTGIYKFPVNGPIYLDSYGVQGDHINNLKVHGGLDKACYSYGENYYDHWKGLYPNLEWTYGMFGENLTISEVDETVIKIGDVFKIGESIIQVSQPRQPCNKFAAKFGTTKAIRQFIDFEHPGVYFRVIQPGYVRLGDEFKLDLRNEQALTVRQIYQLLYSKETVNVEMARESLYDPNLSASSKKEIRRYWKV